MRPTLTSVFMIQPSKFEYKFRQFRVDSFCFENLFVDNPRSFRGVCHPVTTLAIILAQVKQFCFLLYAHINYSSLFRAGKMKYEPLYVLCEYIISNFFFLLCFSWKKEEKKNVQMMLVKRKKKEYFPWNEWHCIYKLTKMNVVLMLFTGLFVGALIRYASSKTTTTHLEVIPNVTFPTYNQSLPPDTLWLTVI